MRRGRLPKTVVVHEDAEHATDRLELTIYRAPCQLRLLDPPYVADSKSNCVFAPKSALILAGKHNRELLEEYVKVEREISYAYRQDVTMAEIKVAVDSEFSLKVAGTWNM